MFLSSTIQVFEQPASRLTVFIPSYVSAGIGFILGTSIVAVAMLSPLFLSKNAPPLAVALLLSIIIPVTLPWIGVGIYFLSCRRVVTLDRNQGTATIQRTFFGAFPKTIMIPFNQITAASTAKGRPSPPAGPLALTLTEGKSIKLGILWAQPGSKLAEDKINHFLWPNQ